ncbi:MAG: glycosyltransferase [Gaiellaceae bacterium]
MPDPRIMLVDPSGRGGLVTYTGLVARALHAANADVAVLCSRLLNPRDYAVPFLARMPNLLFGSEQPEGLRLYKHRASQWLGGAAAVVRSARALEPNVVHFQHAINRRLDHRLLQLVGRRAALVWTAHDVLPHEATRRDGERFARIYRSVDAVITLSEPAADALRDLCGVEAAVLEHPVDDTIAPVDQATARNKLGLPPSERLFGALGFIREYKGYDLLADTWEALGADAPRLLVMGEVHSNAEQALVERLGRSARVDLRLGFASESALRLAVSACDALLLPYAAGSDSGLLHLGRALGTPVIASDAVQLASSVRTTQSGLVVSRSVAAWASALRGPLPQPPMRPPSMLEAGDGHLEVYSAALRRAIEHRGVGADQLAVSRTV